MTYYIRNLFNKYGADDYIGEEISQLSHSIQAAMQAEKETDNVEIIIAALLHDIGHLIGLEKNLDSMDNLGITNHESIGAKYALSIGLSTLTSDLIEGHVRTKRYLVSTDSNYFNSLSDASKQTFNYQGKYMTLAEIKYFKENPNFHWHLRMRYWDDHAKDTNIKLKSLDYFLKKIENETK